jgi:hypothetical protein
MGTVEALLASVAVCVAWAAFCAALMVVISWRNRR